MDLSIGTLILFALNVCRRRGLTSKTANTAKMPVDETCKTLSQVRNLV